MPNNRAVVVPIPAREAFQQPGRDSLSRICHSISAFSVHCQHRRWKHPSSEWEQEIAGLTTGKVPRQ